MLRTDSVQAEKDYLARTGSSEWERAKPFSHKDADTLSESARLLHDFAVAMMILAPGPNDLILDLGAGGCWCSDLLRRLHRRSIAVDIALDMLKAGRSRPGGQDIPAVLGDLQALPFRDRTFQKAICLNALHHVPDMPGAVREIGRVLTDDGVVLFSEPGLGHAHAPDSKLAVRDFGVLEQDVLVADFARAARSAGFSDTKVKILTHAVPWIDLTPEQFQALARHVATRRPFRALKKMRLAITEFFGLGKRDVLFGDTLGMSVLRVLYHASEEHPVLVASKRPLDRSVAAPGLRATIDVKAPADGRPGEAIAGHIRIMNSGSSPWAAGGAARPGVTRLGLQLLDADYRLLSRDYHRIDLPNDVAPGAAIELPFTCPMPAEPGIYALKFDLVAEGIAWFETTGSHAATHKIRVDAQ
jgi:ubiquinone/menaquinone biosynthesis C-methylase UbiE